MIENKETVDFSKIKNRVIEICANTNVHIGASKLKSKHIKHIKHVLRQVWPELRFIPREGMTDIVCSRELSVDEALCKAVSLEKSLNEMQEQSDLDTSLKESFENSDAKDVAILHEAATILRKRIKHTKGLQNEYYSSDELSLENQRDFLDPLLVRFVTWLSAKSKLDDGVDLNETVVEQTIISISSDITTLVQPSVITPKHLGLTVYLHHTFGSKKLIEDLNVHGYTLPYTEVRHFLTSAALHTISSQQKTPSDGHSRPRDNLIIAAADNWDHNENTLSGKHSTHAMTSILVHTTPSIPQSADRIKREWVFVIR
ncbi:hypothetical protein MAR_025413 [Mya arenaria]|uniref:Uncharacterized protein n=1 Tax=Mya arenaria TaxID=6604 RepID=A0ABY7DWG7_MYAAR|nr:hypothetical protein MAR_025413 [Mya arenaria]